MGTLIKPWMWSANPVWSGIEAIPDERPLLFVGNHTLYGFLDVPLMFVELYQRLGLVLRPLGDHIHFQIPGWGELLTRYGVVDGTRPNCAALMEAGEAILVFPGGGREVAKRKGEKYTLVWKERIGFIKMAIAHGCTIVPFAAVGIEDAYDIRFDIEELMRTPVGPLVRRMGWRYDVVPPLATGIGPTLLPRPHRLYFHFGEPVRTAPWRGEQDDDALCFRLRDEVQAAVEDGIARMQRKQADDPPAPLGQRLGYRLKRLLRDANAPPSRR